MLKVVENYTLRRRLPASASLWSRLCKRFSVHFCVRLRVRLYVRLYFRLYFPLYVDLSAKAGCALLMPVLSRVAASGAMQGTP